MDINEMMGLMRKGHFTRIEQVVRNAWQDIPETFRVCEALAWLEGEFQRKPRHLRKQRDGLVQKLAEKMTRLLTFYT